ncbi:MAG: LPS export ABC transporter permease LptG [Syntrophobacterales bacterium]|nr:LPS export ABC transporter permease LptG [Syntrophobacterales bacterium]
MKRLNKYLVWNVIKILSITEFGGMIMFMNIEFFEHMDIFTNSLNNFLLSIGYLALRMPFYFNLILPLAFLISMLILLMVMIRSNEMIVVRTSGISTISLMKPLAAFSIVMTVFSFILSEWVIPVSSNASEYLYRIKIKKDESYVVFKNNKIWFKRNNMINNIGFFDNKKDMIRGLTVIELSPDYTIKKRFDAKEGIWKDGSWVFSDVSERIFDENSIISKKTYRQLNNLIQEPPSVFKVVEKNPEEMGYSELSRYIKRLRLDGHDVKRYLVDLYNKLSFPFINLIMVLAAFSVGLRYTKTKHISKGIFAGMSIGIFYWFLHSVSLSLGYSEIFPPLFAAWFSNLMFFSFGVIGIVTLRT